MKIVMVDLQAQYRRLRSEIDEAMQEVLHSAQFIRGPQVKEFSDALSRYLHGAYAVPCGNGTDALQIALMALDLQPDDEVILPAFTYAAAAEVTHLLRLQPRFVDAGEDFNIDVAKIEEAVTSKTKAIIPVHHFGQTSKMDAILNMAQKHNLFVIEDNAQSLGADYFSAEGARKAGTIGDIGTTSFFPTKNLACFGDGGAMITQNQELAKKLAMIANHGQQKKYYHEIIGVNSRLDTLQAAVLKTKLQYLDDFNHRRRTAADQYDFRLKEISEIKLPVRNAHSSHVFHQYVIQTEKRDALQKFLADNEIPSMIYYPLPLPFQPAYQNARYKKGRFPRAEKLSAAVLSLPIHTEMNEAMVDYICDAIVKFFKTKS